MKYIVYATNKDGEGRVQRIAELDDIDGYEIHVGHFSDDVVISIEKDYDDEKK